MINGTSRLTMHTNKMFIMEQRDPIVQIRGAAIGRTGKSYLELVAIYISKTLLFFNGFLFILVLSD